jgi:hypothetical protein
MAKSFCDPADCHRSYQRFAAAGRHAKADIGDIAKLRNLDEVPLRCGVECVMYRAHGAIAYGSANAITKPRQRV